MQKETIQLPTSLYLSLILFTHSLNNKSDMELVKRLCSLANDEGKVVLSTQSRLVLCQQMNIQSANLSKYIKRLKSTGLLVGEKGEYILSSTLLLSKLPSTLLTLTVELE